MILPILIVSSDALLIGSLVALVGILYFASWLDLRSYCWPRLQLISLVLISVASDRVSLLNLRELLPAKVRSLESIVVVSLWNDFRRVWGLETSVVIDLCIDSVIKVIYVEALFVAKRRVSAGLHLVMSRHALVVRVLSMVRLVDRRLSLLQRRRGKWHILLLWMRRRLGIKAQISLETRSGSLLSCHSWVYSRKVVKFRLLFQL